ncbi:Vps62-related protein [Streptomyces formicae]|uniref:Vps62-related protein n=1 Tax=Streptomyces formicae TaxID=1616117 RepID=A0ABY3WI60_9ACTN|nr:Vps62-related protein [Streptomyces formicae]UNM12268.1 Vps62-related protein [Streptomyces formicae]
MTMRALLGPGSRLVALLSGLLLLGTLLMPAAPVTALRSHGAAAAVALLSIRPTSAFTEIYDDSGTGADDDVSIWRPDVSQTPGYYPLGDVAMDAHGTPPANSFVVSGPDGALAPPVDYWLIWTDRGSGGDRDGSLWAPVAPAGYRCLGSVAVNGYSKPPTDLIRCVKSVYVVAAEATKVWDDSGSGADTDLGIWEATPADAYGLAASTFIGRPSHADAGGREMYQVLNKTMTDAPVFSQAPMTAATARAFAPRVWLESQERYLPSSVEHFLPNVREDDGYLVTRQPLGCDSCTDPVFLRGQNPDRQAVSSYAQIVHRTQNGAVTNITDIFYWMFYPYNQGKDVCLGWDSSAGCIGGTKSFGNHVGDWSHLTIRFVDNLPHQIYLSAHSSGQQYLFGDKHVQLANWRPTAYAGRGSHELYATAGEHVYYDLPNGGDLADQTDRGTLWDTAQALVPYAWQPTGAYTGSLSWLNITSRWGNPRAGCLPEPIDQCVLEDGPTAISDRNYAQPPLMPLE